MLSKEEIEDFKIKIINAIKNNNEIISDSLTSLTEQERLLKANNIMNNALHFIDQLESDKQKLIEKLEEDIVNITKTMQDGKHCDDYSRCRLKAYRTKTKEILEILK